MTESDIRLHRSRWHLIVNFVVSAGVLAFCVVGYAMLGEKDRPVRTKRPKPNATAVVVAPLVIHDGPVFVEANGVVEPVREIRLATEVPGRVTAVSANMRTGRLVSKDEVLIRLDRIEYELEVERLERQQAQEAAELNATDVGIENTEQLVELSTANVQLATAARARSESLTRQNAASTTQLDLAKQAELTSRSSLVELENRKRELVAERKLIEERQSSTAVALKRAELDLARTVIKSPIAGRVVIDSVEEDSYLAAGTSFVTIEDVQAVEVRANLTVNQMYRVWNSVVTIPDDWAAGDVFDDRVPSIRSTVRYRLGDRTYEWDARLERMDGAGIDLDTRTYPCLFRVDKPNAVRSIETNPSVGEPHNSVAQRGGPKRLMRGMFVTVQMDVRPSEPIYRVPEVAIRPGNRMWLNVDGQLEIVPVDVINRSADGVLVDATISATSVPVASVVISPLNSPLEGMAVSTGGPPGGSVGPRGQFDKTSKRPTPSSERPATQTGGAAE